MFNELKKTFEMMPSLGECYSKFKSVGFFGKSVIDFPYNQKGENIHSKSQYCVICDIYDVSDEIKGSKITVPLSYNLESIGINKLAFFN